MDTADLSFLQTWHSASFPTLQTDGIAYNYSDYRGSVNTSPLGTRGKLQDALEVMFQNITLSMLSEPDLQ